MKTNLSGILTLLLAFVVQISFAQERTVSGLVSDDSGPLPGVSVLIEGTTHGTETDFDGKYTIEANTGDILQFSFVGMTTVTKTVGNTNNISITMVSNDNTLDEVVVTAFGIERQSKSLGYAATKISGDDLTQVTNINPIETLSGKIAGVDISAPAQPGASAKVIFRGISSITGSNRPLYVINGSPILDKSSSDITSTSSFDAGTGINDLDPNTIESINFLKGASATALYGSRGANGVIIITTKKGKNKISVDVTSTLDFSEVARVPHYQSQFGTGWAGVSYSNVNGEGPTAQSNENGSWGPEFNGLTRPWSRIVNNAQLIKPYIFLEDNVREFYEMGQSFSNSITISGGNENSDLAFTYSNIDSDGVIPTDNDSFEKSNYGINAGIKSDKFSLRVSANYIHKNQKAVPTGQSDDAGFGKSLTQEMIQIPNDLSIVDMEDQSIIFNTPSYFYTPYATNPWTTLNNNNVVLKKDRFYGNTTMNYAFTDKFSATFNTSVDVDNESTKRSGAILNYIEGSPQDLALANTVVGGVQEIKRTDRQYDTYLNLNYNTTFANDFNLYALAGVNYNERNGDKLDVTVRGLDLPDYYEITNSANTPTLKQEDYLRRTYGLYASVELGYKERYILTLAARNDWSSTLPLENNSYFYPSASLAAIIVDSDEHFLKLRAGVARVGNDTFQYQVFSTASQATNAAYFGKIDYPFGGVNGYEIDGRIENQQLKPEITDEIELGFEGRFFRNRLGLDVAIYNRKTTDLIVDLPVARSTGYNRTTGNFLDITNKGIELAFTAKPVVSDNFTWDLTYTFTKNLGNIDNVIGDRTEISIYDAYSVRYVAEEGEPLGSFYAPTPDRTDSGQIIANENTGYYTYDGDDDYVGSSQRDFIMGLNNSFSYKNLRLNIGLDWKQGGMMYSYTKRLNYFVGNGIETTYNNRASFIIPNSVVSDGAGGYVENTTPVQFDDITAFYNTTQNQAIEGEHVIDKTFIRLRDIVLSYSLPSKLLGKSGLSNLIFSIYGKNLYLWTPSGNSYVDPETTSYGRGIRSEFGEFAANPSQRTYGASVKFSF